MGFVGAIVIGFTLVAFFLLDFERLAIHWWALFFLLLSELVFFGGLISIPSMRGERNKVFLRAGLGTALFLYFAATAITVISFTWFFSINLNHFILIQLAIVAFFGVVSVLMLSFSRRIAAVDQKSRDAVSETEAKRGGF